MTDMDDIQSNGSLTGNPLRLLIVDDEAIIRELLTDALDGTGYDISVADNGHAALEFMRDNTVDLLLTDIMMPQMDGLELIRRVHEAYPETITMVMTGYATLDSARAAFKEGAYDYVLKPFNITEVKVSIENAFERKRLRDENARLREITELLTISNSINTIQDERRLLEMVLTFALNKVRASRGSIMVFDSEESKQLKIAASCGIDKAVVEETRVNLGEGIAGWVAEHAEPVLVTDIENDEKFNKRSHKFPDTSFVSVPLEKRENSLALPMRTSKRVLGVLNVNNKVDGTEFSDGDLKILSILANQAASALENSRLFASLQETYLTTIQSLVLLLEHRDAYTSGHSLRVTAVSVALGRRLGMSEEQIENLRVAATLHDIGKVGVPDYVLNKPGALTEEEWNIVKRHPVIGHEIIAPISFLESAKPIVKHHHERYDGHGYPDGRGNGDLSLPVKIVMVADAFDAMNSDRAYRKALSKDAIREQIRLGSGSQFDPEVADEFRAMMDSGALDEISLQNEVSFQKVRRGE
ncbi:MAG: response regulator [Candidatus Hydrogenedentes bacterium]|nr:response regulator [Candidatus Hydrogenedentota bacterium]